MVYELNSTNSQKINLLCIGPVVCAIKETKIGLHLSIRAEIHKFHPFSGYKLQFGLKLLFSPSLQL